MNISKQKLDSWESRYRLKFINSISGYKSAHLVGTVDKSGVSNLGIFNSILHISSNPARMGFIMRPLTVPRDTYNNIKLTNYFTINHVHKSFLKQAHYTSAKFDSNDSEYEKCNLTEEYIPDFFAPFVKESKIKIGLKLIEDIEIKESKCRLVIGEVQLIEIDDDFIENDGQIDLEKADNICITGLNQYSTVKKLINLPYARVKDLPNFKQKTRPDNIAFDDEKEIYNAKILPYGSNLGAPSISTNNLSTWKNQGVSSFNHVIKSKIDNIKKEYETLVEEYNTNELLYNAEHEFEPIIGEVYHLYKKEKQEKQFLSLIPPHSWKREHLGSYKINSNRVWEKVELNNED